MAGQEKEPNISQEAADIESALASIQDAIDAAISRKGDIIQSEDTALELIQAKHNADVAKASARLILEEYARKLEVIANLNQRTPEDPRNQSKDREAAAGEIDAPNKNEGHSLFYYLIAAIGFACAVTLLASEYSNFLIALAQANSAQGSLNILISPAYAAGAKTPAMIAYQKQILFYVSYAVLALTLIGGFFASVYSKNAKTRERGSDLVKTISGFFIGTITGKFE